MGYDLPEGERFMIPEGTIIHCRNCLVDMYRFSKDIDEGQIISPSHLTRVCMDLPDLDDAVFSEDIPSCPHCGTPIIFHGKGL